MLLKVFKPKRTTLAAKVAGVRYKLLQIMYGKKDGSIFISFPYFENTDGLVSLVNFPGGIKQPTDLGLTPGGKVTSHLVKYSHHPDGRAHFSQDSKVRTEVLKNAAPIAEINGHFFTAQLQGLHSYKSESKLTPNSSQKVTLDFDFGEEEPESIKIVGRLYSTEVLVKNIVGDVEGPIVPVETNSGEKGVAFLVGDPIRREHEKIMLITGKAIPRLDKNTDTALTFIGGFDHVEIINNTNLGTTFLALAYPVSDYNEMRKKLGTVDFER